MSRVFFSEIGSGRPLIFVHGFCDTHDVWADFAIHFSDRFRVLTPDLPGFGNSELLPPPFTIDQSADVLARWIIEHQLEKPLMIGHSLGGYVTLAVAEKNPSLLSGIGLFHSTPFPDSDERKQVRNKVIEFVRKNGVAPYVETFVPGLYFDKADPSMPGAYHRANQTKPEALIGYAGAMRDRPDRSSFFQKSTLPKLIIAGREDTLIPLKPLQELTRKTPDCVLEELPKAAHMGFFEAKFECQRITTSFADRVLSLSPN